MNVLIENYRGFEIKFDNETELFSCSIDSGYKKGSKSYAAIKKYVDDWIKDNTEFKPFKAANKNGRVIEIIGIRKDERFVFINEKGEKEQLSEYYEKDYIVYNPEIHDQHFATLAYLKSLEDDARIAANKHYSSIVGDSILQLKANYIFK